ncbi:MAG: carboxymuconolactone decarboxylase family protein [Dehalococcoidia bacterium]|nr:carboxymuconolactone decarboxylase family protein [Dehalococcoidia bacterium]
MTTEEKRAYIEQIQRDRGYVLDLHKIMVEADLAWVKAYDPFVKATYTGQRTLDRKTKELLQVAVETALRADVEQIRAHIKVAVENGATLQEVLEALQAVVMPMGMLAYREGLKAWAAEAGISTD